MSAQALETLMREVHAHAHKISALSSELSRIGGFSPKVSGIGALRPKRVLVIPIHGFARSLKLPSAVRFERKSKLDGGDGLFGAVSVSKTLR